MSFPFSDFGQCNPAIVASIGQKAFHLGTITKSTVNIVGTHCGAKPLTTGCASAIIRARDRGRLVV